MIERYQGCILGLAVGDALGWPTEFLTLRQIRERYGPDGITDFVSHQVYPAGTFTDDTQMSIALAEGLLDAPDGDLDQRMHAVARRFAAWSSAPDNNRAPGTTCMSACRRLLEGHSWRTSGITGSKGCGSAMRAAPIGLLHHGDQAAIRELGQATSQITHGHPCALAGSVAVALAVSLALDSTPPEAILNEVIAFCRPLSAEFADHVAKVPSVLEREPEAALAVLGDAWVAEEAVADALYCFLRTPTDYRATVLTAANSNGDSDSIACIAGAISGAYNGRDAIPATWRDRVEQRDQLVKLADRLYRAASPNGR